MIESEPEGIAEALRRISACRDTRSEGLDLSGLLLPYMPDALLELHWLKRLLLGPSGDVRSGPEWNGPIGELVRPRFNAISSLPDDFASALPALRVLDLSHTGISDVSPLVRLRDLMSLDCSGCHLDHPTEALWRLPSLSEIVLFEATLGDEESGAVVPAEVLSQHPGENCRASLLRYFDADTRSAESAGKISAIFRNARASGSIVIQGARMPALLDAAVKEVEMSAATSATTMEMPGLNSSGNIHWAHRSRVRDAEVQVGHRRAGAAHQSGYFISYAWGDETPEGREREAAVDRLCDEARQRGIAVLRDKTALRSGDRISRFMSRLGRGDRIFVVLSDRYLRSANCMHELFEIWRNCREDDVEFIGRTRVFVLPSAKISTPMQRAAHASHWRIHFEEMRAFLRRHDQLDLSDDDNAAYRRMTRFANETANILKLVQDTLSPRAFEEFVKYGFDDPPQ